MLIVRGIEEMSAQSRRMGLKQQTIGFVPTMGALHAGHTSLIRQARKENDRVVVSIFVNPVQFGPREDLKKYPRGFRRDTMLCRREGVDIVFYPAAGKMYPDNYMTYVTVEGLSDILCGKFRPGHFRGVATVVAKLFHIVNPDTAYFGQKDAQQAAVIKRMARDLNMTVKIRVMPIIRERDGLALSSRNVYLGDAERQVALVISRSLRLAGDLIKAGARDSRDVTTKMRQFIRREKTVRVDYISILDPQTLRVKEKLSGKCLIALAVWIGRTRLIDNLIIE